MRIVFLNQFFWPDSVATSQFLTDLATSLSPNHEVIAICGGVGTQPRSPVSSPPPKVTIIRTANLAFGKGTAQRLASYLSYVCGTAWNGLCIRKSDVIVSLTTPPLLPLIGALLSLIKGSRFVIWEMDVYPDIATDVGYFRKAGPLDVIVGALADWSRRRASKIIALGEDMKARLVARGIAETKIRIAENWADGRAITPQPLPDGPLVIQYSGNFGVAHEVETIAGAIEDLGNHPDFRFVFIGSGSNIPRLQKLCTDQRIRNVDFLPSVVMSRLGQSLAGSHLGLVTQHVQTVGSVVPSKIYGIMAAGRPLLYIGPPEATPATYIKRFECGWHIQPGDRVGLRSLLLHLNSNRVLLRQAGACARRNFERFFDLPIGVNRITEILGTEMRDEKLVLDLSMLPKGE